MLRIAATRQLTERDVPEVLRVLRRDPVTACTVLAQLETVGGAIKRLGAQLWTVDEPARSLCYSGANLIPLHGDRQALAAFVERARRQPRACSSLVGRAELVLPMWQLLERWWGAAREVRACQPLLALTGPPRVAADPLVRRVRPSDLDAYLPAAVAMFTEEVGVDPNRLDGGRSYRRRVRQVIAEGRAYARFEHGAAVFKAEVGASCRRVGQIQGVWVRPDLRGRGRGLAGTAAVAAAVRANGQTPTLYVNDFNQVARRVYERVGFVPVATFATVLLD